MPLGHLGFHFIWNLRFSLLWNHKSILRLISIFHFNSDQNLLWSKFLLLYEAASSSLWVGLIYSLLSGCCMLFDNLVFSFAEVKLCAWLKLLSFCWRGAVKGGHVLGIYNNIVKSWLLTYQPLVYYILGNCWIGYKIYIILYCLLWNSYLLKDILDIYI